MTNYDETNLRVEMWPHACRCDLQLCKRRLQVPDNSVAMKLKCPLCGTVFIAEPDMGQEALRPNTLSALRTYASLASAASSGPISPKAAIPPRLRLRDPSRKRHRRGKPNQVRVHFGSCLPLYGACALVVAVWPFGLHSLPRASETRLRRRGFKVSMLALLKRKLSHRRESISKCCWWRLDRELWSAILIANPLGEDRKP